MDFRRSLIASVCIHLFLLVAGFITFPSIAPHQTEAIASIPVDIISDAPQVKGAREAPKMEQPQVRQAPVPVVQPNDIKPIESDKPVEPKTAPEEPQATEEAPPEEKKTPEKAEKKPDEADPEGILKKIEEAKKLEEKKKAEEKKKLAEEKKKAEAERLAKQATEFDPDKISNLLNKQEGAQAPKQEQGAEQKQASLGNPKGTGTALTQNQHALMNEMIEKQVRPCYAPPLAANPDLIVSLTIMMHRDGSLDGRPRITNNSADPQFRATADAAVRAIMRCSPLKLPAEWYDIEDGWKKLDYDFKINPEG